MSFENALFCLESVSVPRGEKQSIVEILILTLLPAIETRREMNHALQKLYEGDPDIASAGMAKI